MPGRIAHDTAEQLRAAIADVLDASPEARAGADSPARDALLQVVAVLESNGDPVVLPADALVSTQKAAELLGVSRMTVVRLIDRGELSVEGGGVHRRISADEIERYRAAAAARRRAALRNLAQDLPEEMPADQVISTR